MQTVNTGIKLDASLHSRLKSLSEIKDRTPHWLMKTAISQYIEREEASEREKREDIERMRNYKINGGISHEKVMAVLRGIVSGDELPCK